MNWIGDELFVNPISKSLLSSIEGISFIEVLNTKGTEAFDDIFQLNVPYILEDGMIEEHSDIRCVEICPVCKKKKYVLLGRGMLSFNKNIFENVPDIVKTGEIFGSMHYAERIILVRNNIYKMIKDNGFEKNLLFEPIRLL